MYESDFAVSAPSAFANAAAMTFQQRRVALESIMAEWGSNRTVAQRRNNIAGTGTGTRLNGNYFFRVNNSDMTQNTIFDDAAVDRLWGDDGTDWFFANTTADRGNVLDQIRDRSKGFATEAEARESLLAELVNSEAIQTQQVKDLYQTLLGRQPTDEELATQTAALVDVPTLDDRSNHRSSG